MQFKSIILSLVASVALVRAVAIPQPEPQHNVCIVKYSAFFQSLVVSPTGTPSAFTAAGDCSVCLMEAIGLAAPEYFTGEFDKAKITFDNHMGKCPAAGGDRTFDTCIEEYSGFFEALGVDPKVDYATSISEAGECSACLFQAIYNNFEAYIKGDDEEAMDGFDEDMETCNV